MRIPAVVTLHAQPAGKADAGGSRRFAKQRVHLANKRIGIGSTDQFDARPRRDGFGTLLRRHHRPAHRHGLENLVLDAPRQTKRRLDDGSVLPADLVVESVGSHANVEWLEHNDLDLSDGLLCDNHLRVEGLPGVVAVGDVARFPNPRYDDVPRRVEHWSIPGDTAKRAAETLAAHLAGRDAPDAAFAPLPSFWSDQFGLRLQSFGAPGLADSTEVVEGSLDRKSVV